MGLSLEDLMNALHYAHDAYGAHQDLNEIEQAQKNLGDACDNYLSNMTSENRAKVRDDWEKLKDVLYDKTGSGLNNLLPDPLGTIADLLGINPLGDLIKGLGDKANAGDANADYLGDVLQDLRKGEMSDMDKGRCLGAEGYFKQSKNYRPPRRDPLALAGC